MRLRIRVDVRKPLKRKKKICKKDKSEVIVQCKYERLGDFCFTCGLLSHTERFCKKKLDSGMSMVNKDWGSWLRAPPCKGAGGSRSKWLRDEGNGDWGSSYGKDNQRQNFSGVQNPINVHAGNQESNKREVTTGIAKNQGLTDNVSNNSNLMGRNPFTNSPVGPEEDESLGLNPEERKRRRSEASLYSDVPGIAEHAQQKESLLSHDDCNESNQSFLAKLAEQASQLK